MMGWPMVPSADLYAGGPAYPLSSLGVRLRARPTEDLTILGGVFQDNPPGGPFAADGQLLGPTRWGGNFNLRTGALFIAEVQYAINQPSNGQLVSGDQKPSGLPGLYKLGVWFDTAPFPEPAIRQHGPVARRSQQYRDPGDAVAQLEHLRRGGPDGLAARPRSAASRRRFRPRDGRARRPQPDQLQRQCRRHPKGAAARPATTTPSASASGSPRSAAVRSRSTRRPISSAAPSVRCARPRPSSKSPTRSRQRPGGPCSPTSSTSSRRAAGS